MQRTGDLLYGIYDKFTGEDIKLLKTTTWLDGTAITDAKTDGVLFRKIGTEYFKRADAEIINPRWFGVKGDGITDDSVALLNAIKAANGLPIKCDDTYLVSLNITNEPVNIYGKGVFIQSQGKNTINVNRTAGTDISVSSVSTFIIGDAASGNPDSKPDIFTSISVNSLAGINNGDIYILSSQDSYDWSADASGNASNKIFKATLLEIKGIALNYTGGINSTPFVVGDTVTGGTSGAIGVVTSTFGNATGSVIFNSVSGNFVNGESLVKNSTNTATTNGTAFIITNENFVDTFTTSPILNKLNKSSFRLDGITFRTASEQDAVITEAQRKTSILLQGVVNPLVNDINFEGAFSRAVELLSCWKGKFNYTINKLPNNAIATEGAYGYGIDIAGCSHATQVSINGGNCRHLVTTNVTWNSDFQFSQLYKRGYPKFGLIHDSVVVGNNSAGFDTHAGCYNFTFANCKVIGSKSGKRFLSTGTAFQNRGIGTRYINCEAYDTTYGFIDNSAYLNIGYKYSTEYVGCKVLNYGLSAFYVPGSSSYSFLTTVFDNCFTRGDGRAVNTPFYQQAFYIQNKADSIFKNGCVAQRFNGTPISIGDGNHYILDFIADHTEMDNITSTMRIDNAAAKAFIGDYKIIAHPTNAAPAAQIRFNVASATTATVVGNIVCLNKPTLALLQNTGAGTGSLIYSGVVEYNSNKSTDATFASANNTTYPTTLAVKTLVANSSKTGTSTQSGNGTATSFNIPHTLGATPSYFNVVATSQAAGNIAYITANATNIIVYYSVAPVTGTNNLSWNWIARA